MGGMAGEATAGAASKVMMALAAGAGAAGVGLGALEYSDQLQGGSGKFQGMPQMIPARELPPTGFQSPPVR